MSTTARADLLADLLGAWRERGRDLERQIDLLYSPPGSRFTARYGLPPRVGCKGTTRDGRPCAAHAAIIGPTGYCHWHDPALGELRAAWCAGRRGSRLLRWWAQVATFTGQALPPQGDAHPEPPPLPPLDLAGVPDGQRRAVVALLASPTGRTYAEAAAALGLHVGSLHRHLGRLRAREPLLYATVLAHRAAQLDARHEASRGRRIVARADYRVRYRATRGGEPWEPRLCRRSTIAS